MLRAKQRLLLVVPLALLIIVLTIYLNPQSAIKTAIVLLAVPFSLVGAFWAPWRSMVLAQGSAACTLPTPPLA
jgi:Cu/Ag efflux pump CusA